MTRQINTSACRSKRTNTGRGLLTAPEVKGNWAMKRSPNTLLVGVVDGVFRRVVAQELLVGSALPLGVLSLIAGQDDDVCDPRLGSTAATSSGIGTTRSPFSSIVNSTACMMEV